MGSGFPAAPPRAAREITPDSRGRAGGLAFHKLAGWREGTARLREGVVLSPPEPPARTPLEVCRKVGGAEPEDTGKWPREDGEEKWGLSPR